MLPALVREPGRVAGGSRASGGSSAPGFAAFWWASSVSDFGTYVTTLALQVLVVTTLAGSAFDVGLVNAARWLPHLALGLVVGAAVERVRRKPLLVATDAARALLLLAIPALAAAGWLSLPVLVAFVVVFGLCSLFNDAAHPSFLARLVPASALLGAHARLDQSAAVAQTTGPAIAGALVAAVGAPAAVVVDAATFAFSALATWRIALAEAVAEPIAGRHLRVEIAAGLRWVYHHRVLAPMAITGHAWFAVNAVLGTAYVPFVLRGLGLSAFELGLTLAAAGIGALVGALASTVAGRRWGAGRTVIAAHALGAAGWVVIALAPAGTAPALTVVVLAAGQLVWGLSLGISNANEMGYRQSVTPDVLQSRMNTTIRSINRAAIVIGAPAGGLLADQIGFRPTLAIGAAGFLATATALALTPFRDARHGDPTA